MARFAILCVVGARGGEWICAACVGAGAAGDAAAVGVDVFVGVAVSVQAMATNAMAMQVRASEICFIRKFLRLMLFSGGSEYSQTQHKEQSATYLFNFTTHSAISLICSSVSLPENEVMGGSRP